MPSKPGGDRLYFNGSNIPIEQAGEQYKDTPDTKSLVTLAKSLESAIIDLHKYSDGQPRDDRGRWIDAGGGSSSSGSNDKIRYVNTGGHRNEEELSQEQLSEVIDFAVQLGMPRENIRYGSHYNVSYGSNFDQLYIGTDVYPSKTPKGANERLTFKASIAHEIVGHREACLKHQEQEEELLDEIQASIRAARFAPGLSNIERIMLLRDAGERAKHKGIRLKDVKNKLFISER